MVGVPFPPRISFPQVNEVAVEDIRPRPQGSSPVYEYSIEEEYLKARQWVFMQVWLYQVGSRAFMYLLQLAETHMSCNRMLSAILSFCPQQNQGHVHWWLYIVLDFLLAMFLFLGKKCIWLHSLKDLGQRVSRNHSAFPFRIFNWLDLILISRWPVPLGYSRLKTELV